MYRLFTYYPSRGGLVLTAAVATGDVIGDGIVCRAILSTSTDTLVDRGGYLKISLILPLGFGLFAFEKF